MSKRIIHGILIGAAAAAVAIVLQATGWLARLEGVTWDWRVRIMAAPGDATDQIVLVLLDQDSLNWAEKTMGLGWPWPREVYAAIIGFCSQGGARSVTFDVLFTEASDHVDQDRLLGEAIAAGPPFAGAVFFEKGKATFPIPDVATNATVLGSVIGDADRDGTVRRIRPVMRHGEDTYPTLGLAAWVAANPGRTPDVPVDRFGRAILRWRGESQEHPVISAQAVIQSFLRIQSGETPVVEPSVVAGKYVLFGFTAPGLMDLRSTPLSPIYPGVEVNATLLDNFLSDDFMRDLPGWASGLVTVLLCVSAGMLGRRCSKVWQIVLAMAVGLALPFGLALGGYAGGWWVPVTTPTGGVALALVGAIIVNYALEGRQKRFIKGAFKQYLSPVVIDALVKSPERLKLGGELRELSIFFSDVQGFTGISEGLDAEELTALLNTYLTAMTDIILDEGGTIDKYEGDAIIAFWNAPLDHDNHPVHAVRAALRCQAELIAMRANLREEFGRELFARIGLNTGEVVVGNMGSNQRFDYTFLGDAGNLASRLEGVNKQFGTSILISEYTAERVGETFPMRELGRVRVVGRGEPVRVFEPWGASAWDAARERLQAFDAALQAYYAGKLPEARQQFEALQSDDPAAAAYARRCASLDAAAPADWDGVWTMTEK